MYSAAAETMAGLDWANCLAASRAPGAESCRAVAIHVVDDRRNFSWLQMAHFLARTKADRPYPCWLRSRLFLSLAGNGRGKISAPTRAQKLDGFKPSSFAWASGWRTEESLRRVRRTVRQAAGQSGHDTRCSCKGSENHNRA